MVRVWVNTGDIAEAFDFPSADGFATAITSDQSQLSVWRRDGDTRVEVARFAPGWVLVQMVEEMVESNEIEGSKPDNVMLGSFIKDAVLVLSGEVGLTREGMKSIANTLKDLAMESGLWRE